LEMSYQQSVPQNVGGPLRTVSGEPFMEGSVGKNTSKKRGISGESRIKRSTKKTEESKTEGE